MKKFFKITGITIAVLLALMIILPIVFKGKIVEQVKIAINENVNAEVDFGTFRISLLRNFPNVSFRLNDLTVVGIDHFQGDTLASVKSFFISVNIMSLFGDDGYEVKTIRVDDSRIMAKVLKDGRANWDIVKESEEVEQEVTEEDVDFKVALRRFQINNAYIVYDDREINMYARLINFNHTLRGDFTADFTTLSIRNTTIEALLVRYDGIAYLNNVYTEFTADIDADLNDFRFTFRDNSLRMNDLTMVFDGSIAMPGDDMEIDFTFASPRTDFKAFLSMIPAIYTEDFDGLETSGTLAFNGFVKGIYNEDNIPGFGVNIEVDNGMFQYPDLPAAVTDVFIRTKIENPGGDADYTVVDVSRFTLNMAGNAVQAKLNLKTPVSDPQIDGFLKGRMDLSKVRDFYPMDEGEALSGIIESDMTARGRMSSIENERYNEFVFTGNFLVNGLNYTSEFFPQGIEIATAEMTFSPQFANLRNFSMKIGDSDLSASGRIDNILAYALSDELLTGRFETRSAYFNLNQFMDEEPDPDASDEPFELSVIEVPANIDFNLQSRFERIVFSDLEITNATGAIRVADQTVSMNNLRMNMLGGSMTLNGSYATHDVTRPVIDFDMNISGFDIANTFNTFNTFAAIAPIGERASGRFNAGFKLQSSLDEKLEPILSSLAGGGNFSSAAITVENSPSLTGLADQLKMDIFRQVNVRDVNVNFAFADGRVEVQPFDLNLGRSSATLSGNHGFDQSINYLMGIAIPREEFGGAANQALDNLLSRAADRGLNITPSETVNVAVAFTGTVDDPQISLRLAESAEGTRQQVMDAIEDAVRDVVDETRDRVEDAVEDTREQISEELERRANQVVAEAERQAQNIRNEARSTAETIKKEAREQAKNLENEASGPIAKAAARRTGEQLIKSADDRADNMVKEADTRADRLVREANQRADRIRAGEE